MNEADAAARPFGKALALNSLLLVSLLLCAVRLYVCGSTGLADDEAYYRLWSLAPALSYLDHPPMIAWIIGAGRALAGDTPFGIRIGGPILILAGAAALWRTAALFFDRETASRAVWFLFAMPLIAVGGVIVTPDLPSVLFAGLVLWSLAELDHSQNARWLLATGVFAGFGLLSKYTGLFLGVTVFIWLIAVPANRRWFRTPELWIGGAMAALLASPVVIWNAEHGWASFTKQFGRVARSGPSDGHYIFELIGGFVGLASPIIALLAFGGFFFVVRRAIARRERGDVLLAAAIVPMLAYFMIHALHDRVQANWLAPLYPPLAICAAIGLDAIVPQSWRRPVMASGVAIGLLSIAAIYAHAISPISSLHLRKDPTSQMRGWPDFGDAVEQVRRDSGASWISTSSYAATAQLDFALKGKAVVEQLNERIRYVHLPVPDRDLVSKPSLYVELSRRANEALLREKFGHVVKMPNLIRADGSADGATYSVYLVSEPVGAPL